MSILSYIVGRCLLRKRLKEADITQQEIAEKMGVTVQQINKYVLNKQKMSIQTAKNVSSILKCQIEDLYEWIEVGDK